MRVGRILSLLYIISRATAEISELVLNQKNFVLREEKSARTKLWIAKAAAFKLSCPFIQLIPSAIKHEKRAGAWSAGQGNGEGGAAWSILGSGDRHKSTRTARQPSRSAAGKNHSTGCSHSWIRELPFPGLTILIPCQPCKPCGEEWEKYWGKKRQIALGTNIFSMAPTLWILLQHGHPLTSTQSRWCTPRYPHGPTHVSARASKLQTRDGHKNLCSKQALTNNPTFKLSCCLILNSITSNMPVAGGPALRA